MITFCVLPRPVFEAPEDIPYIEDSTRIWALIPYNINISMRDTQNPTLAPFSSTTQSHYTIRIQIDI